MGKKAKKRARSATRPESSGPNEPAKKRPKVHGAVSKCSVLGKPHGAEAKAVLATVYENLTEMPKNHENTNALTRAISSKYYSKDSLLRGKLPIETKTATFKITDSQLNV